MSAMARMCSVQTVGINKPLREIRSNHCFPVCTCRPYLLYGIEEAIRGAQNGGVGVVVYCGP